MEQIMEKLWYRKTAENWNCALPLGNGFMGAMCFGGTLIDRFALNNDSVFWGGFRDRINPDAKEAIEKCRVLLREGRIREAEELADEAIAAIPEYQAHYEPLADAFLIPESEERILYLGIRDYWSGQLHRIEEIPDYRRELDIRTGIHTLSYTKDGVFHKRESFISYPDRVMVIRCEGSRLRLILERVGFCEKVERRGNDTLLMTGQTGGCGVKYALAARVIKGNPYICGRVLHMDGDAVILLSSQTDFYKEDYIGDALAALDHAAVLGYEKLRSRHISDVIELMDRCVLSIDCEDKSDIPTDERLKAVQEGAEDLGLINQAFAYGRYLLVASSRPGSLPANLQGIWNESFTPPWDSKYTININAQMNYWPAEVTNLSELHLPLLEHLKRMVPHGREAAQRMYGARGWVAHHNTDIWGDCAPQDTCPSATYWQMGAAWLCLHIFEHYRFTHDEAFLEEYLPIAKEAALFFEDTLVEDAKGRLVVSPSISPENTYIHPSGERGNLCEGASMDAQILYELFHGILETGMVTEEERERYRKILDRLPKPQIAGNGTIMEWAEEYGEVEIGHRHISHLFALYPGQEFFDSDDREAFLAAAEKTLERRLSHGGGHTGWSRAWIINLWARLGNGEKAGENVQALLQKSMLPNLFDNHPPFQIDGNFGLTAGIAEMFLQTHCLNGPIDQLGPAIPKAWKRGKITGLRGRDGLTYTVSWEDGDVVAVVE